MSDKLITIVIAMYNAENCIKYCLDSLERQKRKDFKVIIVNDGSTDDSKSIVTEYMQSSNLAIEILDKPNGGLSSARNFAFPHIKTEYLTFLDSDDYLKEDYIDVLLNEAIKFNADVVCSGQYKITLDGKIVNTISFKVDKYGKSNQRRLNISGKIYRTSYIISNGIDFPEGKTYEDNSFNLQAFFLTNKIRFVDYEGYYQVVHEGSITAKPIKYEELPFAEWERVVKKIKKLNIYNDMEMFDFTFISFATYFLMVRNRKREYLSNDNELNSMDSIYEISKTFERIVKENFENFEKNKYGRILAKNTIGVTQKIGTYLFYKFAKANKLNKLVNIVYRMG